jgi:hypothetical protein
MVPSSHGSNLNTYDAGLIKPRLSNDGMEGLSNSIFYQHIKQQNRPSFSNNTINALNNDVSINNPYETLHGTPHHLSYNRSSIAASRTYQMQNLCTSQSKNAQ